MAYDLSVAKIKLHKAKGKRKPEVAEKGRKEIKLKTPKKKKKKRVSLNDK